MLRLRASRRLLFSLITFYQGLIACQWFRGGQFASWLCPKPPDELGIDFRAKLRYTIKGEGSP